MVLRIRDDQDGADGLASASGTLPTTQNGVRLISSLQFEGVPDRITDVKTRSMSLAVRGRGPAAAWRPHPPSHASASALALPW